jgi:DNA (cytosine-5)-methyltransferase 1
MTARPPRIGSVCSGYRGLDAAVEAVFGGTTAWVADIDPGANQILAHHWPDVPNLGDITTVDWTGVEPVDVLCGGYPCQPFSDAGLRKGTADERHIWPFIATAVRVLRPRYVVLENVRGHLGRGFDTVLGDLAALGFDAQWCVAGASEVGAPHQRKRLIVLATPADAADVGHEWGRGARNGRPGLEDRSVAPADAAGFGHGDAGPQGVGGLPAAAVTGDLAAASDTPGFGRGEGRPESARVEGRLGVAGGVPDWGQYGPAVARWEAVTGRRAPWAVDDRGRLNPPFVEWMMGLPAGHVTAVPGLSRNAQLKALGNGVVPQQAEAALRLLLARITSAARAAA